MKRCIYKNSIFIACDYLLNIKINEESQKTFTRACITLLPRIKRDYSYIYLAKAKKVHFEGFSPLASKLANYNS